MRDLADIDPPPGALRYPSTARNREPIRAVLAPRLPARARVLEIASGSGEHGLWLCAHAPGLDWTPSDPDPDARRSVEAWRAASGLANLRACLAVDASDPSTWPEGPFDAVVCINMIHISPWAAGLGLLKGASTVLAPGGTLYLYGPFIEDRTPTTPGNLAFDADLKARNPAWGVRRLETVAEAAAAVGLDLAERVEMPANNLSVLFRKRG